MEGQRLTRLLTRLTRRTRRTRRARLTRIAGDCARKRAAHPILLGLALLCLAAVSATGEVFVQGNAGWFDNEVNETTESGSPFDGGFGAGGEVGFSLFRRIVVSGEFMPGATQPRRAIPEARGLEDGRFKMMAGNVAWRLEPIEKIQPYLMATGGLGTFTFDYGDTGRVFVIGGVSRRLTTEDLRAWVIGIGGGFESPLRDWLLMGVRGRYLFTRWRGVTEEDRGLPYPNKDGYAFEATLKFRI